MRDCGVFIFEWFSVNQSSTFKPNHGLKVNKIKKTETIITSETVQVSARTKDELAQLMRNNTGEKLFAYQVSNKLIVFGCL